MQPQHVHDIMRQFTIGDGEPLVIDTEKSHGSWVVDACTGKKYLDCSSQFASQPLGWNHPKLIENQTRLGRAALHKIANSDYYTEELAEFTARFGLTANDFSYFFFIEGGAAAVENALKAAFDYKAKRLGMYDLDFANSLDVIHLEQAFHGRSGYTLSLTNTVPNKTALFPKFSWTRIKNPKISYPRVEREIADLETESLHAAEKALKTNRVAAILLESIQGEGGDNHFRPEYFVALRSLADKYDCLLILDEVQAGLGLTGKMWAYQHFDIVPDMIVFGKKTQVCGFCSTRRIDSVPNNVFHTSSRINSTWGGNIVDMVRFSLIARIIHEENLLDNAEKIGNYLMNKLSQLPRLQGVRGKGLMIGFDLETQESRNEVLAKLQTEMLILPCGEKSIRLRPHLTFSQEDANQACEIISHAL